MAGEAWAKLLGIGGTGTSCLLESDSMTNRIALGVAGSPIAGPLRFANMLLPALGSTLALRNGRSSFLGGTYVVLGSSMGGGGGLPVSGAGVIWFGCKMGGAEGRLASDFRRASSSRAAASFLSCLSSLMTLRSPELSVTSCIGAGVGNGASIFLRRDGASDPACDVVRRTSDLSLPDSRVDQAFDRTDTGEAGPSPRLALFVLRLFL